MRAVLLRLLLVTVGALTLSATGLAQVSTGSLQTKIQAEAAFKRADYGEAARLLRLAADQGDEWAQYNLGLLYDDGKGVPQNYAEAIRWYRLAADQGYALAQSNLGAKYAKGQGVPQNDAEAVRWFRLAADQGNAGAQFNMGIMYYDVKGVPQNYVEAYKWWSLAAAQGHGDAAKNRDIVRGRMMPAQVAEGQRLAAEWKPK